MNDTALEIKIKQAAASSAQCTAGSVGDVVVHCTHTILVAFRRRTSLLSHSSHQPVSFASSAVAIV